MKQVVPMQRIFASILTLSLLFASGLFSLPRAQAEETLNLNELSPYANRTREEVATRFYQIMQPSYYFAGGDNTDYYLETPSVSAPYQGGVLKPEVHKSFTDMVNYYRWLLGVEETKGVSQHNGPLQKAAVIEYLYFMDKQTLTHFLHKDYQKPADMEEAFWSEGANAPNNIVSAGYRPQGSIEGFFDEGYSHRTGTFDTIGHRYTLLSKTSNNGMDFAYANFVTFGLFKSLSSGNGSTNLPIVPFPAPGYFPSSAANSNTTAWSFELGTYTVPNLDQVQVEVTNLRSGESYTATKANGGLNYEFETNIVYRQPKIDSYRYQDSYRIDIRGLADPKGIRRNITYTTHFTDITDYANSVPTSVESVKLANAQKIVLQPSFAGVGEAVPLATVAQVLPQLELTTTTKYTQKLPVTWAGSTSAENTPVFQVTSYNPQDLHNNISDPQQKILNYRLGAESATNDYNKNAVTNAEEGKSASIPLKLLFTSDNTSYNWYKLKENGQVEPLANTSDTLTFSQLSLSDSGKYFATYIHNGVFRVTTMKTLNVKAKTLSSIKVKDFDQSVKYYQGDELQLANARLELTYSEGSTVTVPLKREYISGFNPQKVGSQTLSVSYGGKTTTLTVEVLEKTLVDVRLKNDLNKKEYRQGEALDLSGAALELIYINGTSETIPVNTSMVSGYDRDQVGTQQLTFTYQGKTVQTTVKVLADAQRALELAKEKATKEINSFKQLQNAEKQAALAAIKAADSIEAIEAKVSEYRAINQPRQALVDKRLAGENLLESMQYLGYMKYLYLDRLDISKTIEAIDKLLLDAMKENKKNGGNKYLSDRNQKITEFTAKINALDTLSPVQKNEYIEALKQEEYFEKMPALYEQAVQANTALQQALLEKQAQLQAAKEQLEVFKDLSSADREEFIRQLEQADPNGYAQILEQAQALNQQIAERKAAEAAAQALAEAKDKLAELSNLSENDKEEFLKELETSPVSDYQAILKRAQEKDEARAQEKAEEEAKKEPPVPSQPDGSPSEESGKGSESGSQTGGNSATGSPSEHPVPNPPVNPEKNPSDRPEHNSGETSESLPSTPGNGAGTKPESGQDDSKNSSSGTNGSQENQNSSKPNSGTNGNTKPGLELPGLVPPGSRPGILPGITPPQTQPGSSFNNPAVSSQPGLFPGTISTEAGNSRFRALSPRAHIPGATQPNRQAAETAPVPRPANAEQSTPKQSEIKSKPAPKHSETGSEKTSTDVKSATSFSASFYWLIGLATALLVGTLLALWIKRKGNSPASYS